MDRFPNQSYSFAASPVSTTHDSWFCSHHSRARLSSAAYLKEFQAGQKIVSIQRTLETAECALAVDGAVQIMGDGRIGDGPGELFHQAPLVDFEAVGQFCETFRLGLDATRQVNHCTHPLGVIAVLVAIVAGHIQKFICQHLDVAGLSIDPVVSFVALRVQGVQNVGKVDRFGHAFSITQGLPAGLIS